MAENKKQVSFSDYIVNDDDVLNVDKDLQEDEDLEQDDPDKDDLEDKTKKVKKEAPKKQLKSKDNSLNQDQDNDDPDADEDLDKGKKKEQPKTKAKVDPTPDPDNDDGDVDPSSFFEEVEKITGTSIDVDYGDIDPLTPQGIALRDKAIKEATLDSFLEEMEAKYPQAFKALNHAYNGGDIAELFSQTTGRDYSKIELKDNDTALAKEILKEYYRAKGVKSESKIAKLIEADEDSETGLVKEAQGALTELKEEQEQGRNAILEEQKRKSAEMKKKDQIFVTAVDEVLESKKLGNFRITDRQEASAFKKFVLTNLQRTEDGYVLSTPVSSANLEKQLQYAYFQFKQGDLSKIIQQKASTENAKKLQLRLSTEQQKSKKTTEQEPKTSYSMKDYYV